MSSIRLFILGSLADRGEMHGHGLRLLAEEEHIDEWTDITVGALYGAIKRLAAEGLIAEVRVEREGNYPERSVYDLTAAGRDALGHLRRAELERFVLRADPVDLALARQDPHDLDALPAALSDRRERIAARRVAAERHLEAIAHHLTAMERHVMRHTLHRLDAELAWHDDLLGALPVIIADERSRKGPLA